MSITLVLAMVVSTGAVPVKAADMNPRLEPFKPLLGKTWRGVFATSTPDKPVVDVSRFELVLNGQAVRNLHSINDGEYGGETLFVWDQDKQGLVYYYFTTAGFYTTGTIQVQDGALLAHETVKGAAGGVTEVKATLRVLPDGRLHIKTEHLKQGRWEPGRETHYTEAPAAHVKFKD